jgi:YgiT-type zinc finger domain-containing protein
MNCPICKSGTMIDGYTSITFEKAAATVVVKGIPATVCDNCGEAFVAEVIARKVHGVVEAELEKGIEVEIVHFAA